MSKSPHVRRAAINVGRNSASSSGGREGSASGGKSIMFLGNNFVHQENMSVKYIPPHISLLYSKTGVCRGIPTFLVFDPKHRLWILIRTASARTLYQCFEEK